MPSDDEADDGLTVEELLRRGAMKRASDEARRAGEPADAEPAEPAEPAAVEFDALQARAPLPPAPAPVPLSVPETDGHGPASRGPGSARGPSSARAPADAPTPLSVPETDGPGPASRGPGSARGPVPDDAPAPLSVPETDSPGPASRGPDSARRAEATASALGDLERDLERIEAMATAARTRANQCRTRLERRVEHMGSATVDYRAANAELDSLIESAGGDEPAAVFSQAWEAEFEDEPEDDEETDMTVERLLQEAAESRELKMAELRQHWGLPQPPGEEGVPEFKSGYPLDADRAEGKGESAASPKASGDDGAEGKGESAASPRASGDDGAEGKGEPAASPRASGDDGAEGKGAELGEDGSDGESAASPEASGEANPARRARRMRPSTAPRLGHAQPTPPAPRGYGSDDEEREDAGTSKFNVMRVYPREAGGTPRGDVGGGEENNEAADEPAGNPFKLARARRDRPVESPEVAERRMEAKLEAEAAQLGESIAARERAQRAAMDQMAASMMADVEAEITELVAIAHKAQRRR